MAVADAGVDTDDIPTLHVPFRSASPLSAVVSCAEVDDCDVVFVGAHSEGYSGYLDYRLEFLDAFGAMVDVGTKSNITIPFEVLFAHDSKTDTAHRGLELSAPFEHTWSCHRAEEPACGACDSCAFRLQTFQNLGECDPTLYVEHPDHADGDADPDVT